MHSWTIVFGLLFNWQTHYKERRKFSISSYELSAVSLELVFWWCLKNPENLVFFRNHLNESGIQVHFCTAHTQCVCVLLDRNPYTFCFGSFWNFEHGVLIESFFIISKTLVQRRKCSHMLFIWIYRARLLPQQQQQEPQFHQIQPIVSNHHVFMYQIIDRILALQRNRDAPISSV